MGLLDDLLGRDAGADRSAKQGGPDMTALMTALLPVVIGMLGSGDRGQSAARGEPAGGGLGGLLAKVLGGEPGGSPTTGGLGELLERFQRAGFGDQARSWVGTGRNLPLPPEAVTQVFGRGAVSEIAQRAG